MPLHAALQLLPMLIMMMIIMRHWNSCQWWWFLIFIWLIWAPRYLLRDNLKVDLEQNRRECQSAIVWHLGQRLYFNFLKICVLFKFVYLCTFQICVFVYFFNLCIVHIFISVYQFILKSRTPESGSQKYVWHLGQNLFLCVCDFCFCNCDFCVCISMSV